MTREQQRIAIAEACGWKCTAAFKEAIACWVRPNGMDHETESIPDYLHDLNAMHEAEKVLTEDQQEQYLNNLYEVCNLHSMINDAWNLNCATASQRAEAFLRTIGKWKEAKP